MWETLVRGMLVVVMASPLLALGGGAFLLARPRASGHLTAAAIAAVVGGIASAVLLWLGGGALRWLAGAALLVAVAGLGRFILRL